MADQPLQGTKVTQLARERTIQTLSTHFAHDALELAEFERRVDAVHRARSPEELQALVADLPVTTSDTTPSVAPARRAAPATPLPSQRVVVAVWAGATRRGGWQPGARTTAFALMGGIELDFRAVALPPGVTEVTAVAIMGGIDIIVPPDIAVEVNGSAFLGGFDQSEAPPDPLDPNRPLLRINGFALMGGVDVDVRLPGETSGDASRRRRAERKKHRWHG